MEAILTSRDVPGEDCYGVISRFADQPVFAHEEARYRGEAVAAIVGEAEAIEELDTATFPASWEELPLLRTIDEALAPGARLIHAHRPENVLTRGRVARGNVEQALAEADAVVEGEFETGFVEHACIEPEAGFARRVGDQIEIQACTQSPYMDRADIAKLLGIAARRWRRKPATASTTTATARTTTARRAERAKRVSTPYVRVHRNTFAAAGAYGLFTHRVHHGHDQAPSRTHALPRRGNQGRRIACA